MSRTTVQVFSINDALDEAGFGKFNYFLIFVAGLIHLNIALEVMGIGFVLPITNCDMDLSYQEKGFLGAVGFLGVISSSHIWGFIADTTGRANVIRYTLILGFLVSAISSFSATLITLILLRYLNGIILCGGTATIYVYLGELHSNKVRNRALMISAYVCSAVSLVYPLIAGLIINEKWSYPVPLLGIIYKPWRMYMFFLGIFGFIAGLCFCFLPESPKFLFTCGRESEAIAVLQKIYSVNTRNSISTYKVNALTIDLDDEQRMNGKHKVARGFSAVLSSLWYQTGPLFMRDLIRKTLLTCTIQFWISFASQGMYVWFPLILNNVMEYTGQYSTEKHRVCEIFYMTTQVNRTEDIQEHECNQTLKTSTFFHTFSLECIYLVLLAFIGFFTEKIGRRPGLFTVLFICGMCGVLSALVSIPIVAVYLFITMLVCGIGNTVLSGIVVDIFPTQLRAMAVCISLMMGRIGGVVGTNAIGALLEYHCESALLLPSTMLIVSGILAFVLPRDAKSSTSNAVTAA